MEGFLCVGQIQPRCLSERRRSLLLALAVVAHLNLKFFKKIQIGGTHYGLQQSQIAFSCGSVMYKWFLLSSPALPPLEQLIEKEQILELMGLLTERQRDIVILYFYYGETQWEIAKELGITQPQFLRRL